MKTTIIIPTFDRAATLGTAIASALRQGPADEVEVLVVDDGSTDDTPALLADLCARHANLRVVRQDNAGVTAARNTGLRNLPDDCDVVTWLDSDDTFPAERLATDLAVLRERPEIELTYGQMILTDAIDPETLTPPPGARGLRVTGIHLSCALFRRHLIDRIGLFDPEQIQGEDLDYLLRTFESHSSFVQTDTLCLYYLRHAGGLTRRLKESERSFLQALHKSLRRRRQDPTRRLVKPDFEMTPLRKLGEF